MPAIDPSSPSQAVPVHHELVRCYRELASTMSLMAGLTRAGDWQRLPELEARSAELVERIKAVGEVDLDAQQRAHVRDLIERIQADQAEVSRLVKPQIDLLLAKMAQLQRRSELDRAYGLPH